MSVSSPSVFLVNVTGQIECGRFLNGDNLRFNYCFTAGHDWEVVTGLEECMSQTACRSDDERQVFVWNFPFDITFKSTNPYGWPQVILSVYGTDFFGNTVIMGYTACHVPITPGKYTRRLTTFVPESASTVQKLLSWLTGRRPEFINPKLIAQGRGREVTRVRSQGEVTITFNVMMKDFTKFGYDCGATGKTPYLAVQPQPQRSVTVPSEGQSEA
ncbi:hypothetical protein Pmani_019452 [Petrolisthes manimaculis]|uniref:B9 domain-containing protein 1 n=1 Tax=Petrolisthes manimaculis TaxID=1843537 RepID=A0AAE1PHP2_9EUCA|nr:hypothetical protein Pmani_019452 [Petrolisthes manimaculis]